MGAYPTINLNDSLPAAPTNGLNVKWQNVASVHDATVEDVSAYVACPGGTSTFLRADGTFATPPGGGATFDASQVSQRLATVDIGGADGDSDNQNHLNNVGVNIWELGSFVSYQIASGTIAAAVRYNNSSTGNLAGFRGADGLFAIGNSLQFVCSSILQRITDVRMWLGLSSTFSGSTVTQYGGSDDPTSFSSSFIGFRFSTIAGDTDWQCVVSNGTSKTVVSSGVAANTGSHYFAFKCNDAGSSVAFYIDGVLVATISADYPTSGQTMEPVLGSAAAASTTGQSFNFTLLKIGSAL